MADGGVNFGKGVGVMVVGVWRIRGVVGALLDVEQDVEHIAVLDLVVLAFGAE